ncbi:MAG: hypothetical protein HY305_03065 [Sphingobacteriales bacterium]|nr:hypothetical protein [Sphingobacteriales bacterium]
MEKESDFFSIRGKSDRKRKRDALKQRQKQLISLRKKQRKLWNTLKNLGFETVETPYQTGFKRLFILRDDIAKTNKAEFYNELLIHINTIQTSMRKDFAKKKRKLGKKIYVPQEQQLRKLEPYLFKRIPEKFHGCFIKEEIYDPQSKSIKTSFVFIEPWNGKNGN